ncbi:hypothetical protein BJ170DRAFT_629459 [Xylariales sp. AK1849]|nr:hypothetical protein BJ170DRAFT_629459 [Xylariales sp. AK1849]
MHAANLLIALAGATFALPTFSLERRGLINLSPTVSPEVDLNNANSCLGLGISVCDPINVGGTQNSNDSSVSKKKTTTTKSSTSHSDSLINISPDISPSVNLSDDNSCTGIGISVCDPINVDGTQGSNNS